jgi:hypothetical protein
LEKPAADLKGIMSGVLAGMDEEARQAMTTVMAGYLERQRLASVTAAAAEKLRLATKTDDEDEFMDSGDPKIPGRGLEDGEEPPAQRAKTGA